MDLQFDDEELDYVRAFTEAINVDWIDGEPCTGNWFNDFITRFNQTKLKHKFCYEAFCDNREITEMLDAYELDVEKMWYLLLFLYDLTIAHTTNIIVQPTESAYQRAKAVVEYWKSHPGAVLCLSDSAKFPKDNRARIEDDYILIHFRQILEDIFEQMESNKEEQDLIPVNTNKGRAVSLTLNERSYYMYTRWEQFFKMMKLPDIRKKGRSFSKQLLVSRIIYFCGLTADEGFCYDPEKLKTIIKDNKNKVWKRVWSENYLM